MEVGDKLKKLNMTADEMDRMTKALKDDKFREMLRDYAEELSDPENRKRYEEDIKLLEQERGNTIDFIHPEPFKALRTSVDGKQKCFINICGSDKVGKPECKFMNSETGRRGHCWSLPHSLHPGKQTTTPKGNKVMIYDVVFHPDTLHIASKNKRFMDMVESTAMEGIESNFKVTLDKKNVKQMSIKYKGTPQPCVIRRPIPGYKKNEASEKPDPLAFPYPDEKTSSQSKQTESKTPKSINIQPQTTKEPTKPNYTVKYRSFIDLQDFRYSRDSAQSPRPKEIVVTIDVPLLKAVTDASLEVTERNLLLESKKPAYRLELTLAYPVDEDKGEAKFNKKTGQLTVTLPVLYSNEALEFALSVHKSNASDDELQEEEKEAEDGNEREEMETEDKGEEQKTNGNKNEENLQSGHTDVAAHEQISEDVCDTAAETEDFAVTSFQGDRCVDISPEEQNSQIVSTKAESQPDLITAENSSCIVEEEDPNLESPSRETTGTIQKPTPNAELDLETDAAFPQDSSAEEPQTNAATASSTPDHSENTEEFSDIPAEEANKSSRVSSGNVVHLQEDSSGLEEKEEKLEKADEDDLATEQIFQKDDQNMPLPVLLREIDKDGNVNVIREHSTSAGFIFENSLMFELD